MGAIAPIRTAMVHFPKEFRAHVPPGKFWDWSSLRCSLVHSGRFKLANAWIPYWTCNAQIFNKPQEGGRGRLGPPLNPPLDTKCYLEQQWKAIFAWDWNKSFTHTYTHTPTPNIVSEQLATEGFGELNTSPYYWIFTSVSVGSIPRYYSVAERGEVPGGPPSTLIFRPNWGPKGPKKNFFEIAPPPTLSQGLDERPPPPLSEGLDPPPLLTYSFPLRCKCLFKLHQSVAQNLSSMWRSTFELGASQPRSVTKFAPKSYLSGMVFVLGQELTGKVWS